MVLGSIFGLLAYFWIGFYTSALIGTFVSMLVSILGSIYKKENFEWKEINNGNQ